MKRGLEKLWHKLRRLTGEVEPRRGEPPSAVIRHGHTELVVMPSSDDLSFLPLELSTRDCQLCEAYVWDLGPRREVVICPRCAYQLGLDEAAVKRSVSVQVARM